MWIILIQSPDVHKAWIELSSGPYEEAYRKAKELVALNKERGIKIDKWQVVLASSHWEQENGKET